MNILLNFPAVQTLLTHTIADYYSKKLHTKIHIGRVDFEFLKKLVLKDVYIEDLHKDTLLYATALKCDIGQVSFKSHQIYFSNIDVDKAKIKLITYKNDTNFNLQYLLDAFSSKDTTKSTGPGWNVSFGKLSLNGIDFRRQNLNDTTKDYGLRFVDLDVRDLRGKISTIRFMHDTIRAVIENISLREKSGFVLKKFSCYVNLSPRGMELDELKIQTANTDISTDLVFKYANFSAYDDFVNKVDMKANFHKSKVCFDDIGYFAHSLKAVHNCFTLSGEYKGTVNHLKAHNMSIGWGKFSYLEGEATIDNMTEIDTAFIKVNITHLVTSKSEIEALPIPPFDKEDHLRLPENISKLGDIHFDGYFDGTLKAFKASGHISTGIGDISAHLHMWEKPGTNQSQYTGLLETKNFNLGSFWELKDLGTVTTSVTINGKGLKKENADATLSGVIQNISFRKYTYQNTAISGELKKGFFSGFVKVTDPHVVLDFAGKINLASQNSVFNFETHIAKANLTALHFIKDTNTVAFLSSHIIVNATGNTADNLEGTVYIDSTSYAIRKEVYQIDHLALSSTVKGNYHNINLKSDYADGQLSGHFNLANTFECLQNLMSGYIPSIFPKEKHAKGEKEVAHDYLLSLHFNENTGLTNLFAPGVKIASGTIIKGRYDEATNNFNLNGSSDEIDISSKKLKKWKIEATGDEKSMIFNSGSDTLYLSDSLYAAGFVLNGNITRDTVHYDIQWNNDPEDFADIPGYVAFPNKSRIAFKFQNPVISLVDSVWKINSENLIVYDSSRWSINSFVVSHGKQSSIALQGFISNNDTDKLGIKLHNFNLANLKLGTSELDGMINGTATVSDLFDHPYFTSAIDFSGLAYNKQFIGNGTINSRWDTLSQSIFVDAHFLQHGSPILALNGKYTPGLNQNNLSIDASLTDFPTKLFQPYLKDVCSILDGSITGQAHITGEPTKPLIYGNLTASLNQIKFDYLNTSYHSPALNIVIVPDTFRITRSVLLDEKKKTSDTAILTGTFTHNNFRELQLDLHLEATNFLCLNTTENNNSSYFGKAYVTGGMDIYGFLDALQIDADVTTDKNTVFNIPLTNTSDVDQGNYIQFTSKTGKAKHKNSAYKVNLNGLQMNFRINVTEDATANILLSSKGEVIQGVGYGNIQFSMDNTGTINMQGTYNVTRGYYNFVLQNIINKKFLLQPGGSIAWSGDPYNADIKLTTTYATTASLEPFFPPQDVPNQYNKRVPVNCNLMLTGKLTTPLITFGIELPTVDNTTSGIVNSYLSNGDELTTQVFSLLIINSFTPVGAGLGGNGFGTVAGVANSAQLLSNQLTNMFNNINQNFNVGLDIQPGTAINPAEYKLAFSSVLFKGKVAVNTNVGAISGIPSGNQTTNSNFVGEVTVEYKLSKNGKLRVKAFNKANDNTALSTLNNSPYTQGAGFSYKEGFNSWKEFLHKVFGRKPKAVKIATDGSN